MNEREELIERAFEGHDRMDREALGRWRRTAGKGGHDLAPINLTSLARLIATIDTLVSGIESLSPPPTNEGVERLERLRGLAEKADPNIGNSEKRLAEIMFHGVEERWRKRCDFAADAAFIVACVNYVREALSSFNRAK